MERKLSSSEQLVSGITQQLGIRISELREILRTKTERETKNRETSLCLEYVYSFAGALHDHFLHKV